MCEPTLVTTKSPILHKVCKDTNIKHVLLIKAI